MIDQEKFQEETIKAINSLRSWHWQMESRQVALTALVRAILAVQPAEVLAPLVEAFDAEVDHQAAQIPPERQLPRYWQEFSALIANLRRRQPHQPPTAPGTD